MKVPAITVYNAIVHHIDSLCSFEDIPRRRVQLILSDEAIRHLCSLPEYAVPRLSKSMAENTLDDGLRAHFMVGKVIIRQIKEDPPALFHVSSLKEN